MASVEVESVANTMPAEKLVEPTPEAPKEVEPVVAAPEPVVEEPKEAETVVDAPPPVVEEPAATPQVVVEADVADVVEEAKVEAEETKAETTTEEEVKTAEEEVKTAEEITPVVTKEEVVPEETPGTNEVVVPEDAPVTEEAKEAVEEGEMPTDEVVATPTEVATEE